MALSIGNASYTPKSNNKTLHRRAPDPHRRVTVDVSSLSRPRQPHPPRRPSMDEKKAVQLSSISAAGDNKTLHRRAPDPHRRVTVDVSSLSRPQQPHPPRRPSLTEKKAVQLSSISAAGGDLRQTTVPVGGNAAGGGGIPGEIIAIGDLAGEEGHAVVPPHHRSLDFRTLDSIENKASALHEAIPMSDTQDNDARGWSRMPHKYRVIIHGLVLVAMAAVIAVVARVVSNSTGLNAATDPGITSTASPTIMNQQGPAIVGDAANDELGESVALSADAKTLVVGAPGYSENNEKMGYVKIYRADEDGEDRVQLGETIYGDAGGDRFGWSVDVSRDGNTLAIGSPGFGGNNDRPGYVRVFFLESGVDLGTGSWKQSWNQIGDDIVGEANGDEFGYSVALSEDGKMIVVGAVYNDGNGYNSGHVRVYRLDDSGSSWTQLGEDIDGDASNDELGRSVALSADAKTLAVGAPGFYNSEKMGYVKVYRVDGDGGDLVQLGETIDGGSAGDYFGTSVDISSDGNTLAIGSPGYWAVADRPGYVRVFSLESSDDLDTGNWTQIGDDIIGEANGDDFGISVSISDDGKTIAVGAWCNDGNGDDLGHVRVYRIDDSVSSWMQLGEDIDGEAAYDYSGVSVSLSADGKTVAIGSFWNDDNGLDSGHVRVFVVE